jgi:hypothetical protein
MFVTNDPELYEHVLTLSNHGRARHQPKQFWPDMVGFKYKMSNIQAAIGRIGSQPALPDQAFQLSITTKGRLTSEQEFGNVVVRATEGGGHVMKARFAPHPHIWMLVVAIYFALGLIAVAGAMYGLSLMILGGSLWPFWLVPGALAEGAPDGLDDFTRDAEGFRVRFTYQDDPTGVMIRLMAKRNAFVEEAKGRKQQWRNGMILMKNGNNALFRSAESESTSVAGITASWAWPDEPLPERLWGEVRGRRKAKAQSPRPPAWTS